jgi:hypothetical protein
MLKNILAIPFHFTIGVLAIIVCSYVSLYEIFTLK